MCVLLYRAARRLSEQAGVPFGEALAVVDALPDIGFLVTSYDRSRRQWRDT